MIFPYFNQAWRLVPGALAAIATLGLGQTGTLASFENVSYRWLFQVRGSVGWDDRITLITIDDATLTELGQHPLPRETYTQLLRRLETAQPISIGFNLLFSEPSPQDEALAQAIAQAGNVVLATGVNQQGYPLMPTEPLQTAALSTGHIYKQVESDGLVHTITPWEVQQTAFGVTVAEVFSITTQETIYLPPLEQPLWINWPGSLAELSQYSLIEVLLGVVPPGAFDDKLVLVGMTATGTDAVPTPFDLNPPGHGLLIHAAVIDNLLRQRYLRPLHSSWLWLLLLFGMPGISYYLIGKPLRWQLLLTGSSLVLWLSVSLLLFHQNYWLPTAFPMLLFGLTGTSTIVGERLRENCALQRLLSDLWQHYRQNNNNLLAGMPDIGQSLPEDFGNEVGNEVRKLALLANALERIQATQAAIARTVPVGLIAVDDQDYVWFCNPLAAEYLGLKLGSQLTPVLVPNWLNQTIWQNTLTTLWTGNTVAPIECQHAAKWFEFRFERLEEKPQLSALLKQQRGFLMLIAETTHRKAIETRLWLLNDRLEEEVRQRTQALEQSNRDLRREILERQQIQKEVFHQALHDALTGLPNRLHFKTQLNNLLAEVRDGKPSKFAVLFLDCDRFKLVNDSFGHLVGDELLKAIAQRLRHAIARTDIVARFGGDEFIILLKDLPEEHSAIRVARRIRQRLQAPFLIGERQLYTGCSIGIVLSSPRYQQADELLRDADTAMYRAKRGGLGFTLFEPEMHLSVRTSLQLETDLRRALQNQELYVQYQPIFAIATQHIEGFEALIRWKHPQQGVICPDRFIPIAEETGLIIPIGWWILHQACHQLRTWQQRHLLSQDSFMSVNLSVQQFNDANLLQHIDEILQETQLSSRCLKLEITESVIMENSDVAIQTCYALRERGIHLSIDDFGTGYSSLNYLHCFPFDVLKVDRIFIHRMENGPKHLSLVQAIQTLSHHFGMAMVAEGIETEMQMHHLKAMHCPLGQGYLFSPPLDGYTLEHQYLSTLN